jgi:uncharacterized protein YkwD
VTLALSAPADAATSSNTSQENQVSVLINTQRTNHGCGALSTDEKLRTIARAHSADMVAHNYFSHTAYNGATFATRIFSVGYTRAYAENIAWGQRTPASVVNDWMNSAGHRANILNCSYNHVGVGVAYKSNGTPYWTQDFGRS